MTASVRFCLLCTRVLIFSALLCRCAQAQETLRQGLAELAGGAFEKAASRLSSFVRSNPEHPSAPHAMCGAGQAYFSMGDDAKALECFHQALASDSKTLREAPVRLACARCCSRMGKHEEAAEHSRQALQSAGSARERTAAYPMLISSLCKVSRCKEAWAALSRAAAGGEMKATSLLALAHEVGAKALAAGHADTAKDAFGYGVENETGDMQRQDAALGYAWAQAALATKPQESAEALLKYVEDYPDSRGAPRALLAAGRKKKESGSGEEAVKLLEGLVEKYSESGEVAEALKTLLAWAEDAGDRSAQSRLRLQLVQEHGGSEEIRRLIPKALLDAATNDETELFQKLALRILVPSAGAPQDSETRVRFTRLTLDLLDEGDVGVEALIRFAEQALAGIDDPNQAEVFAAVVDWMFSHDYWEFIARLSSDFTVEQIVKHPRSASVIAESMHRSGKTSEAYTLYSKLAALPGAPFIAMLRSAELAVSIEEVGVAEQAIQRATAAAASSRDKAYTQVIASQLAIRRAQFGKARTLLSGVVHSATADLRVRARAQWLLGETYFMQGQYRDAIEEYRRCETRFPQSGWTAASLVQAGKAFERLGQFPEALACYNHLLKEHKSSPYARVAQQRRGAIENTQRR